MPTYAAEVTEDPEPNAGWSAGQPSIGAEIREFSEAFRNECAAVREDMDRHGDSIREGFAEMHERMDAILAAQAKTMDLVNILIDQRARQQAGTHDKRRKSRAIRQK